MKFSAREEIAASAAHVWGRLSDLDRIEAALKRRGAQVVRSGPAGLCDGVRWDARFAFRGRARHLKAEAAHVSPGENALIDFTSDGLSGETEITLTALGPDRTEFHLTLEVRPLTLAARLLLQPLKIAKADLNRRFKDRVATFARDIEADYRPS